MLEVRGLIPPREECVAIPRRLIPRADRVGVTPQNVEGSHVCVGCAPALSATRDGNLSPRPAPPLPPGTQRKKESAPRLTLVKIAVLTEHLPRRVVGISFNQPLLVRLELGQKRRRQLVVDVCGGRPSALRPRKGAGGRGERVGSALTPREQCRVIPEISHLLFEVLLLHRARRHCLRAPARAEEDVLQGEADL